MRKLTVRIAIIFFAVIILIIAALSTFVFLINSGRLTHFIERRVKTNTNFDIKIKDIHLDILSDLQLKQISVKEFSDQKQFTLGCNAITINYKPLDLLKRRIKSIDLSGVQIILDAEREKTIRSSSSHGYEFTTFSLKDAYPEHLLIENVTVNNTAVKITTGGNVFTLTEMDMQVKGIQPATPFVISIKGFFSVPNLLNTTHSNLIGEFDINTNYSLPDDGLTILDNSYFLINDVSKFSINGKADSILSSPEINCNISCKSLSEAVKSIIPENFKDWSLDGDISINTIINTAIDYTDKEKLHKMTAVTDLFVSQLKFSSPDYDYFGEGINGHLEINISTNGDFKEFSFDTIGTFEPFLIQLKEFTTDMRDRKTHFVLNGNYDIQNNNLNVVKGSLTWDNLGTITTAGNIQGLTDNLHLNMNIELKKFDNEAFFETFIKDMVEYSNPALFDTHIEGESNSRFQIKGSKEDLTVNGHLNVNDLNFKCDDISIEDTNIDLPISMVYPRSKTLIQKQDIPDAQYGIVRFKKLSYGPLEIEDIQISPIIISNNFFIKVPFEVPVFDGTIDIKNVSVKNAINNDRKYKLEFQLNDISLEALTTTYKLTPFEGALTSSNMSFRGQGQKLYSKDEINIKLFGGDIAIRDLTVDNFLEPMAEIGFSAEVKHLDLGKMSDTYREWGNITGIMNGNIKDFKIVAGEPSGFEIEMKTEKYPDIKQTVSTKFLKNFVPGIGKVLDKVGFTNYKYAVMGLHARLENDYIKLRGAVREGGKELFMKGAGMKRLEIVFPNVDKRVPFKTFLNSFKGMLGSDIDDTQVQFK